MFKKYLIIASKKDKAGINITTALSQFRPNPVLASMNPSPENQKPIFDFYLVEEDTIYTENLNIEKINQYDFVIFASKHQSEKKEKSLTIHAPGNFGENKYGGLPEKACPSSALFNKFMFEKLNEKAKEHNLDDKYNVTLEATHHGPLIDIPCVFIEIGSTETEWNDRRAAFAIAKTIEETIEQFKPNKYNEIAIGIGGPHYCPSFTKLQRDSNVAISHIIAQYNLPINEETLLEAINKTEEEIDFAILDWKGLGKSEERKKVIDLLEKNYIGWKKVSEIKR